jgi:hypothetical protein
MSKQKIKELLDDWFVPIAFGAMVLFAMKLGLK